MLVMTPCAVRICLQQVQRSNALCRRYSGGPVGAKVLDSLRTQCLCLSAKQDDTAITGANTSGTAVQLLSSPEWLVVRTASWSSVPVLQQQSWLLKVLLKTSFWVGLQQGIAH